MEWQYAQLSATDPIRRGLPYGFIFETGDGEPAVSASTPIAALNVVGAWGWELVSSSTQSDEFATTTLYTFKRPAA